MKNIKLYLVCVFLMVFFPGVAQESGIHLSKSATFDYATQSGIITLDTFVEGETHIVREDIPADILFVLDVSGSMQEPVQSESPVGWVKAYLGSNVSDFEGMDVNKPSGYYTAQRDGSHSVRYNQKWEYYLLGGWHSLKSSSFSYEIYVSKLGRMMDAVNTFIDVFKEESEQKSLDHRIGIISFSSNSSSGTKLLKGLTSVNSGADALKSIVWSLEADGATAADRGMQLAEQEMKNARSNSYKAVVMLTDGEPNHGSGFDIPVADDAISHAYAMNTEMDVHIFTIGIFDTEPSGSSDMFKYMEYVSSDYPKARSMKNPGEKLGQDYYSTASNSTALDLIFSNISQSVIEGGSSVNLGAETVLKDIISGSFRLPSDVEFSDIKTYRSKFLSYDVTSQQYIFTAEREPVETEIILSKDEEGCDIITVSGFDYRNYWCGPGHENEGYKLIVEIPFVPAGTLDGGTLVTNKEGSGLYGEYGEEIKTYPIPYISFHSLTISRTDLEKGENAVYLVSAGERVIARVVLQGDGSSVVSRILRNLPAGFYTVRETGWNWAYDTLAKAVGAQLDRDMTLEFTGAHKEDVPPHDEAIKTVTSW